MLKNVASKLIVFCWDVTTGLPKTGDAANLTAYRSLDFGAVTVLADTAATEMDATNAKGYYLFDLAQGETNGDIILYTCKSATANITCVGVPAAVHTLPTTGILAPTTIGRTLDVSAGGEAGVDWANVGSPTTTLSLTGTTIAVTQKVDIETIKTNPVVNAGTVTFPTTATLASTTNITAGTIATVTTLTNLPAITAGWLTATGIDADAITAAKVAADVGTEIGTAVWATTTRVLTAGTNIVLAKGVGVTGFNDIAATDVVTAGAITTSGGKISGVILVDTLTTYTGNTLQTGDSFARIGAAGVSLTAVPWNAGWDAEVQSEVTDALVAYDPPTEAEMNARTLASASYATAAALIVVDDFLDTEIQAILDAVQVRRGTAQAGGSDTITLDAGASASTNIYVGYNIYILSGVGSGQQKTITAYDGTTKVATVDTSWLTSPDNTSVFVLTTGKQSTIDSSAGVMVGSFVDGAIRNTSFTSSAITAASLAADAVTEIGTGVWVNATRTLSAGTNIVLAKGVGITGFNDLSAAQVNAEVDTALIDIRLDELLAADSDIDGAAPPTVGSVFHELLTKTTGSFTFDQTTDSLEALRDRGDAAWITGTALDAAGIRTAVGLASANLDTQLTAIDDFLDTEVGAIKAKTDLIPADPADASDIATAFATVNASLATIASYIDTEVGAIKVVTDRLDTAMELDGSVYRYTVNALELAPTGGSAPTVGDIAVGVWANVTRTLTAGTNIVLAKGVGITGFNDIAATAIVSSGAITTSGGKVSGVILVDTITTYTGDTPQTGDSFVRIGATGSGLTSLASQVSVNTVDDFLDTEIGAIKVKTDLIPADPADASDIAALFTTVNSKLDTIDDFLDTEMAAVLAAVDTEVAAIKAKTDQLTFTTANRVDVSVIDKTGFKLSSDGADLIVIESGLNLRQSLSIIAASVCGVLSGAATTTVTIKGAGVATTRMVVTVDASGNRSATVLTLP